MSINAVYSIVLNRVAGFLAVKFVYGRGESRTQPSSEKDILTGSQGSEPVLHSPLKSGDLTLTQMQDGTLCILHNGIPCIDRHWAPTEVQIARLKFEELKVYLTTRPESKRGVNRRQSSEWLPRGYAADPRFGPSFYQSDTDLRATSRG